MVEVASQSVPLRGTGIKFVAQAEVQCEARLQSPIVLNVPPQISIREPTSLAPRSLAGAERAWSTRQEFCKASKVITSSGSVALLLDVKHLFREAAEFQRMQPSRIGHVI